MCQTGNLGDEQHLKFECPALQGITDRYICLFGDYATTMVQLMQHDTGAAAQFIKEHVVAHNDFWPSEPGIKPALGG